MQRCAKCTFVVDGNQSGRLTATIVAALSGYTGWVWEARLPLDLSRLLVTTTAFFRAAPKLCLFADALKPAQGLACAKAKPRWQQRGPQAATLVR